MVAVDPESAWFTRFRIAVFLLLAWNTAVYLISGTGSEALDSFAWLTLLLLFELETGYAGRFRQGRANTAVRIVRMAAAAAIFAAWLGYLRQEEWLDAINAGLWIGVVAALEFEVRRPHAALRNRGAFLAAISMLYAGLAAVALTWLLRGAWFDAYDAALWLVAFATLELGLTRRTGIKGAAA